MPDSRYFKVLNPDLRAKLEEWKLECIEIEEKRRVFLLEWGSNEILIDKFGNIVALHDPRKMNPPKSLPKGWKTKSRKFSEFVAPTTQAKMILLNGLDYPQPFEVENQILERIAAVDPFNEAKIFGDTIQDRDRGVRWDGYYNELHYMFWISFSYRDIPGEFIVAIPDPTLRFDKLDGFEEMRHWEILKLIDDRRLKK